MSGYLEVYLFSEVWAITEVTFLFGVLSELSYFLDVERPQRILMDAAFPVMVFRLVSICKHCTQAKCQESRLEQRHGVIRGTY